MNGGGQEVICPGLAGSFVNDLLIQGLGGIQTEQVGIIAVLAQELVDAAHVIVAQFCVADLVVIDGHSNSVLFTNALAFDGLGDSSHSGKDDHHSQDYHENSGHNLQLLCFFLLGQLLFGHFVSTLGGTELLLVGCAHGIISSHLWVFRYNCNGKLQIDPGIITHFYSGCKRKMANWERILKLHKKHGEPKFPMP